MAPRSSASASTTADDARIPGSRRTGLIAGLAAGGVSARCLLASVSFGALVLGLADPAKAQLAAMRAAAGTVNAGTVSAGTAATPSRTVTMQEALQRQQVLQDRAKALAGYVTSARSAALAAIKTVPTDGISDKGLNPISAVRSATLYVAASASTTTVTGNAVPTSVSAANDATGINTWEGAKAPVQTTDSSGKVTVTIDQTQQRALLSWQNFDVSANTSLVFNQKQNGTAQQSWTVVNRVVNAVNPSVVLGSIKADGTVLILNSMGVLFGSSSQVNLHSLVASSLELGNFASAVVSVGQRQYFVAATIKDRNTSYLQNGLLVSGVSTYKPQYLSALLPSGQYDVTAALPVPTTLEGAVNVYGGAQITSDSGGMILLAGPSVTNAGTLSASDGQVSLQGGRYIGAVTSTGASGSADTSVRGLIFSSQLPSTPTSPQDSTPDQGMVLNLGLVSSRRGYISLGAGVFGTVTNSGLLSATTSVSRNGKIALSAGTVTLTGDDNPDHASGVTITADDNGETIPQGSPDSPASFKSSQITIGASITGYLTTDTTGDSALLPSVFTMGKNAFIYAPNAKVVIGHDVTTGNFAANSAVKASVSIADGAIIDVSGLKDIAVAASRNTLTISPAKRNELRDTPNYRELSSDGSFTLNGQTLIVDPRISGVRSDGVAWVGSPLLEAASAVSQIPVTAAELMTKGGSISIDIGVVTATTNLDAATVGAITIAKGALLDISGGWRTYGAGYIYTSQLVTSDGRVIDIADADPNDSYVDVVSGFSSSQPHFGLTQTYTNALIRGTHYQTAYDEGRDAGALMVVGSNISFDGTVKGDAFAGAYQIASAIAASASSSIAGDPRKLQYSQYQLPSGGLFRIGSFSASSDIGLGQDIVVYNGTRGTGTVNAAELLLDATMLSGAGLSALMLQTSGAITLAGKSDATLQSAAALTLTGDADLTLANGGTLELDAGRAIRLNSDVTIAGGKIAARTYQLTSVAGIGIGTIGNVFRADDDIATSYASEDGLKSPFDITVTGTLSTAGRWVNDYTNTSGIAGGAAWINGGSISLAVAPRVFVPLGATASSATVATDLSGSIIIADGARLDVSAGGYVSAQRKFNLSATGGSVTLKNETTYASVVPVTADPNDAAGTTVVGQSVAFAPLAASPTTIGVTPALVVTKQNAKVRIADGALRGFGFGGGGTFTLISPDVAFGSVTGDANATHIGLDFFRTTGFGTLAVTNYHSRIVSNLFSNGSEGLSAFFDTTSFTIGSGETLDLTQVVLPSNLDVTTQQQLLGLASGGDVLSLLAPTVPTEAWYQKAANLKLTGLIELEVAKGGRIIGAAQASITTPKLRNAGSIVLHSGTIAQIATMPGVLNASGIGVTDLGKVFGSADAQGRFDVGALNTAGVTNADGTVATNEQLLATPNAEHFVYFVGSVAANTGILLDAGSTTDLPGIALYNPAAPLRNDGTQYQFGKLLAGGSITSASAYKPVSDVAQALFANPTYGFSSYPDPTSGAPKPPPQLAETAARLFIAAPGSTLDISGASAMLDVAVSATTYAPSLQWSNAGTIALRGGGSLAGATVRAQGGSASATGGTLEWLDPTIRATDAAASDGHSVSAAQISAAGFSTLLADGGLTLDGTFTLALNKALLVRSTPSINEEPVGSNAAVVISATAGSNATIAAPYIGFSSRSGTAASSGAATGSGKVTFKAGASGMDLIGGILFDASIAATTLYSQSDVRLIGVDDRADTTQKPVLNGALTSAGDLTFDAARVYTTTGTGNLQRYLESEAGKTDSALPSPYVLSALGNGTITFLGDHINATAPLSAGSYLRIQAKTVVQDGFLAVPLGRIEFGTASNPVETITFGTGSITSVSGAGLNVPYGTTTDLTEYFFTPGTSSPITALPTGELRITGSNITIASGGKIDGSGGGDVFAYEFVSGTGGSRDVLNRLNTDAFSSNNYDPVTGSGTQYADGRQVYAIVPAAEAAKVALYDPVYSSDYDGSGPTNLYGSDAGLAVTLDGGNGIPAGQYVLMPAHYALLPGAYRVVQNSGATAPAAGSSQTLLDGSVVMGGSYSTAGTGLSSSERVSFTVMNQATVLKYSKLQTTSGTTTIETTASNAGKTSPRVPLDAARVVLAPLASLKVDGAFDMTPGKLTSTTTTGTTTTTTTKTGRGAEVDILGKQIVINHTGTSSLAGLVLSDTTLTNLNADSLLIGGQRTENTDDTTTIDVSAKSIVVVGNTDLKLPELILAVGGTGSRLVINDGASIVATGTMSDTRAGDYVVSSGGVSSTFDRTGVGSVLRVSSGPQRLLTRTGTVAAANSNRNTTLDIGAATFGGAAMLLETSRTLLVDDKADLATKSIALVADNLGFGSGGIGATLEGKLAKASELVLRSTNAITFDAGSTHTFNNLILDTSGIALTRQTGGKNTLTINAGDVTLLNSGAVNAGCGAFGVPVCGTGGNVLAINAATLTLGSGTFNTYSFDGAVQLAATKGAYYEGKGALALGGAALTLTTPFLTDRAAVVDPTRASSKPSDAITPTGNYTIPVTPDYAFATSGAISLKAPVLASGSTAPTVAGIRAPGAHVTFGSAASPIAGMTIDGVAVNATSGVIDVRSTGTIALAGAASLATPGYSRSYGDSQSTTTVSAGAGTVNLVSLTGDIVLPSTTSITVDNGTGNAGRLNLLADEGAITFAATLNKGVTGTRGASLTFDSGKSAFDLDGFATQYGTLFTGDLEVRSGLGNLALGSGHKLAGSTITLVADGGQIDIAGTLDTSGADLSKLSPTAATSARVDGGAVALWGMNGVTLRSGALIDTHTTGYADTDQRQATAGDVTIGIGNTGGALTIETGAKLDVAARRTQTALAAGNTGNRLIATTVKDANTLVNTTVYKFVEADTGGTVTLRAPVLGANDDHIDLRLHGTVTGAASVEVEAYKTYDLDALGNEGAYEGVSANGSSGVVLDATPTGNNILSDVFKGSDGTASIPWFIQHFGVTAVDGSNLSGLRLRPGVDLVSTGNIGLITNWNLAAGTVDQTRAIADGLMTLIPELGKRPDLRSKYYEVVAGQEGNLLENYTTFLYRVGGKASGEAGVFSLRAGGSLDIGGSISDGFFTFADKSDATWINYQLGGGTRTFDPALLVSCGSGLDCSGLPTYADVAAGKAVANSANTLTIGLSKYYVGNQEGRATVDAPFNADANSAVASGSNLDPNTGNFSGDALGFAQLFPLLADGSPIRSSSLRLVAGAGDTISANPLHIDRATNALLQVEGETAYSFTATAGQVKLGSALNLSLAVAGSSAGTGPLYTLGSLVDTTDTTGNAAALTDDTYTAITWGNGFSGASADLRSAAQSFFASKEAKFTKSPAGIITGVAARLADVLAFLSNVEPTLLGGIANSTPGYPTGTLKAPSIINFGTQAAYSHTIVRTGDGTIALAASGNIDLRNGAFTQYRTEKGVTTFSSGASNAQVGGTAVYSAGHRVGTAALLANVVGTGQLVSVTPDSAYVGIKAQNAAFLPSAKGLDDQAAVLATGGGSVWLNAGGDVLGRRDLWSERFLGAGATYSGNQLTTYDVTQIGDASQRWRAGVVGQDTEIAIAPKYFSSGVGALAGGDVTIRSGGSVTDLTVALDAAVTTTVGLTTGTSPAQSVGAVQVTLGRGNLDISVAGNLNAGQIDVAHGVGTINVDGSVVGFGKEPNTTTTDTTQYLRVRLADASVTLSAQGSIALAGVSALGAQRTGEVLGKYNAAGFFAPEASFGAIATGSLSYIDNRLDQAVPFQLGSGNAGAFAGSVLPPSLTLAALTNSLTAPSLPLLLYPSTSGNLDLFSAGDISSLVIAMSDSDPSLLPGAFSAAQINLDSINASGAGNVTALVGLGFGMPGVEATTSDRLLRLYHSEAITHAGDTIAAQIFAGNDIRNSLINLPKQARITAGRDIVNLYFAGQNVSAGDTTTITAGRDITGTTSSSVTANLPYVISSNYMLGGPGTFQVQAGRNIGPFINSATVNNVNYAGGIQTVGNDANPWLGAAGADLTVLFGVAKGVNYASLASTYLDPANFAALDGDLFVQVKDAIGNSHPDRTKPVYAPVLASWLRTHAPAAFAAIFGSVASYPDTTDGNAALTTASYAQMSALYTAFKALDPLLQNSFLIKDLYFNELQQTPSIRSYRAVNTLFPASLGYTDNLAEFTTAASTISTDHPQGQPTRILENGQPKKATQVVTGSVDLRLATFETTRGGDITILGPGGNFIGGSVVRTSEQAARRVTRFGVDATASLAYGRIDSTNTQAIDGIPLGYEGVLTLRGGAIRSFVDGNFLVNQSRVFSQAGGNIVMFSSNGDLNAGQGPRSASNFPPVTVRFDLDGFSEVDSAGSVSGAGIGAFKRSPSDPSSSVSLIAPVGTVDAGDAGVRATGDVVVIAARVTNADAISSSGGSVSGVPSGAVTAAAAPAGANAAVAAQSGAKSGGNDSADKRSVITVEVKGYAGDPNCDDPNDPDCKVRP
ncbi:filamentous haemagglutinin family protein [Novosphingobium sp. FKTRR1]|uniref:filamentous haemagglutinin family protein n=1 Tax=Novosphingobium sp. FKTRR1 TaxID=2879118 RepID=UPI001CF013D3|nr:filamentous haemagglutinin family protein [Novosphingobium sp. FKTRR1]